MSSLGRNGARTATTTTTTTTGNNKKQQQLLVYRVEESGVQSSSTTAHQQHQQQQQASLYSHVSSTTAAGSSTTARRRELVLHQQQQQQQQQQQRKTHVVTISKQSGSGICGGGGIGGIGSNNLIIGNISGGGGVSSNSVCTSGAADGGGISYGGACGLSSSSATSFAARITPPTTRVKAKLLIRKGNNNGGNSEGSRSNVLYHQYSPATSKRAPGGGAGGGGSGGGGGRTNRKIYSNPVVGVISARSEDDCFLRGGGARYFYCNNDADYCDGDEGEDFGVETRLLTVSGCRAPVQRQRSSCGSSSRGLSPCPSVAGIPSEGVIKLTTRVTTSEEIVNRSRHPQGKIYSGANNTLSSSCVIMDGGSNDGNNEGENVHIIGGRGGGGGSGVNISVVGGRCSSTTPANQPKKTVQFKRFTSSEANGSDGGGGRNVMSAPPTSSFISEDDDVILDPCCSSSSMAAVAGCSKGPQQGSSCSLSPPRITISSLPDENRARHQHSHQLSSHVERLSPSPVPQEPEILSSVSASSSSDPISDDGEQEIIDHHESELTPRSRGNSGGSSSANRRRCCRRLSCYYYCCCCFSPSSCCSHCCRDALNKHHHQGNYSQGPTIESEPCTAAVVPGTSGSASISTVPGGGVPGQTYVSCSSVGGGEGSITGSFHHRVTPFLPLCLVSVFGFISKVSWGVLESLFGFNRSTYTDHGTDGETERRIRANDPQFNANFLYANNYIKTSKYTVVTFLPLNLFEQFQRLANFYFLCLLVLQMIPVISSLTPYTTAVPLMLVLALTAVKDAYDDYQRHVSDSQVNNRKSLVLRNHRNNWALKEERWYKVQVGDVIRMENDQFVAADVLLLSTSEPNGLCYIETAELDGETNLKCRQCLLETAEMGQDPNKLGSFNGVIVCEPPNNHLNKFEGYLEWNGKRYPLDNDKVLLRGCILRNTQWCYGVVLFAGRDTKLMQNSGKTKFKRTSIDRLLNFIILGIVFFLLSMCLFCTIACGVWEIMIGQYFQDFLPWDNLVPREEPIEGAVIISLLVFFSYAIILNTVVPISLYVSVEVIRLLQSFLINWDVKMYHEASNTPAKARTTTLNEELGQIEYIFSDKTGTLTQNIMTFNKCSIAGKSYGEVIDPRTGEAVETVETPEEEQLNEEGDDKKMMKAGVARKNSLLCGLERDTSPEAELLHPQPTTSSSAAEVSPHTLAPVDFSGNPHYEPKFRFYDHSLYDAVKNGNPDVHLFFRHLALCHTVISEDRTGKLEYQAQSPDENALVSAARNFEFVFKERSPDSITISVLGKEEVYDLLCILDFNNVRKRMSVVVQREGKIMLLCKGADSIIFERLKPASEDLRGKTLEHLNKYAGEGLRTLVLAVKELTPEYFEDWKSRHHEAAVSLSNRDEKLDAIYEEIERDMTLLGATAIEDKLQDGVPATIANLLLAGIKVWVLTGDKQETAINIGYSCQLLTDELNDIFIVDSSSFEDVKMQLLKYLDALQKGSCASVDGQRPGDVNMVTFTDSEGYHPGDDSEGNSGYAVVMNGHSLVHALHPQLEQLFLELASQCRAVICCRVTPLQKALVVELVKNYKRAVTLAIGDGANDVSMIKTAHIGVGISGQEGLQAVLASDYSIAQFRYLERLLLVHGRWSYYRMAKFLRYFFYKNFAFTLTHFWYAFFCGFSAQTVFDPMFISVYNLFYTSLPVLSIGVFDQDCNDEHSIRYPKLYAPGHLNLLFNKKEFLKSALHGFVTSCVLFIVPYGTYNHAISADGQGLSDHMLFGSVVSTILVVVVTAQVALDTSYWTVFNHITVWGSLLFYFILHYIYNFAIRGRYLGSLTKALQEASFWFTLVLTVMILIIPVLAWRFYFHDVHPTLSDRVRLKQRVSSVKTRQAHDRAFRTPSARRSRRSLRSSYAFAHQEGFGPLITSGKIMRKAKSNNNHTAGSTVASLVSSVTSFGTSPPVPPSLARSPRITMVTPQEGASSSTNSTSVRL